MDELRPRLASRAKARELLGGIGDSKLYDLLNRGEIEGVFLDNKRLFVVASIDAYIDRLTNARPEGVSRRFGNLKYCDAS